MVDASNGEEGVTTRRPAQDHRASSTVAADQFLGQLADPPFASLAAAMRRETSLRQSQIRLFHAKEIAFGRHAWSRLEIKFWSATEAHPLV